MSDNAAMLAAALEKSRRSVVGERKRWYELPEETPHPG